MAQFSLGPGDEGEFEVFSIFFDSGRWTGHKGFRPAEHRNARITWHLHARVPPAPLNFYIHEALDPGLDVHTFDTRVLHTSMAHTWAINYDQPVVDVHAYVPLATENRIYELFLYRRELGHRSGDRYYVLSNGEANPCDAVIPPSGSYFPITYFNGCPMSRMEVVQALSWSPVWLWMDRIPDGVAPPEEAQTSDEIESQFAQSALADMVAFGAGSPILISHGGSDFDFDTEVV
ncbi:Monooxygenase [Neofusicoccum parvum]|uniref:Monooxygenase n=1 Tax=Neofusicoccum parvum TaxID=310453 RepID=A0ACB5SHS1_9PEZI|nr:Monooxygenase [Neofusicoccum parvum]